MESGSNRSQNRKSAVEKKSTGEKKSLVVTLSTKQGTQKESILTNTSTSENENSNLPPGLLSGSNSINVKISASKQTVPVVMPSNSPVSAMGVQFGSLNVSKDEDLREKVAKDPKRINTRGNTENGSNKAKSPEKINVTGTNIVNSYPSAAPVPYFQQIPGFGMVNTDFQQVYGSDNAHVIFSCKN